MGDTNERLSDARAGEAVERAAAMRQQTGKGSSGDAARSTLTGESTGEESTGDGAPLTPLERRQELRRSADLRQGESEEFHRALFEWCPDGVVVCTDGTVRAANPAAAALLGAAAPAELVGRAWAELLAEAEEERGSRRGGSAGGGPSTLEAAFRAARPFRGIAVVPRGAVASRRLEASGGPVPFHGVRAMQIFLRDVTATEDAERRAEAASAEAASLSRFKSALVANLSHEIRTPLSVLVGFSSLLGTELAGGRQTELSSMFEAIERAGNRLIQTLHAIADLSEIESGNIRAQIEPLSLARLLQAAVAAARPFAADRAIDLRLSLPEELPEVLGDEYCVANALHQILDNAVKFTEEGHVEVEASVHEGTILCDVRDTGVGIEPAYLGEIFDPFTQEERGTVRRYQGTGIGLTLARRYLEISGVSLGLESARGQGTVVSLRFPVVTAASTAVGTAMAEAAAAAEGAAERPSVLLVEDDPDSRAYARRVLETCFEVIEAPQASDVRRILSGPEQARVAAVVMDVSLRGSENGLSLTRWMRSQAPTARVPVVAVTAHAFPQDRAAALEAGCSAYLAKPFSREALIGVVERLIRPSDEHPGLLERRRGVLAEEEI